MRPPTVAVSSLLRCPHSDLRRSLMLVRAHQQQSISFSLVTIDLLVAGCVVCNIFDPKHLDFLTATTIMHHTSSIPFSLPGSCLVHPVQEMGATREHHRRQTNRMRCYSKKFQLSSSLLLFFEQVLARCPHRSRTTKPVRSPFSIILGSAQEDC